MYTEESYPTLHDIFVLSGMAWSNYDTARMFSV